MPTQSVTGQQLVTNVLSHLGLNEQGGAPSNSDAVYVLGILNNTWNAWGIDEGLIYSVATGQYQLNGGTGKYSIGPAAGAPFNVARPSRIYKAFMVQVVGAGQTRQELRIVEQAEYFSHKDLAASAVSSEELYPDYNVDGNGDMTLYLFPVPSCPTTTSLEIETAIPFAAWTLGGTVILPDGYQDAIEWAIAFRCLPGFGASVAPQVAQTVAANAEKSEARIREMNSKNRQIPVPMSINPQIQQTPQQAAKGAQ